MPISLDCPDQAKLDQHARDDLTPAEGTTLDCHLRECRPCLDQYVKISKPAFTPEIPDCHVVKEIGRGRFGVVYKAWWLKDQPRIVALKVLSLGGEMERTRFNREISVLKKIDSPGIVKCLDSGLAGDACYYIMDHVQGVHLDEYMSVAGRSLNDKLAVFERVCRAVADAHAQGVVHRDLKPRNILIDDDGQPHLLDFGVCAVEQPEWGTSDRCTITSPGDVIGTLKYMSPEQAWGGVAGTVDERSDLWTLGVMLHETVTGGEHPYSLKATLDKPAHEALLDRIRKELPHLPRLTSIQGGRDLEILLGRCLAWEPDRRIESAAALADDLDHVIHQQRIKTKPLGLPYRLKRLATAAAARSRWMCSAFFVAAVAVMLWVAAWVFNVGWHVTGHRPPGNGALPPALTSTTDTRDGMLVIGIFDDTIEAVLGFSAEHHIAGVTASVPTWRAVHGYLLSRLAEVGPVAVVWDYFFRTPQPGDLRLVEGILALEQAGVPVTVASLGYDEDGHPDLSPRLIETLGERLRHGTIVARNMVERPGQFVMVIGRGDQAIIPNLALTTMAAVLHRDTRLEIDWPEQKFRVNLYYQIRDEAYRRERDYIELTRVFVAERLDHPIQSGDVLGCTAFAMQRPELWEPRTVRYQQLLTCSDDELRRLAADKLIVVGDLRTRRTTLAPDRHPVKYGTSIVEDVPGCYLLADAIASLLDRRHVESVFPVRPATFLLMLLLTAVGCLVPLKLATRRTLERAGNRRVLWMGLLGLSASSFAVMILTRSFVSVHAGMAGFSLLVPMAGAFWVEFARNRHRMLDKSRAAIEELRVTTDGTLTLASRRSKEHSTVE
ncbi:MAG: protein kinase [Planctomycetes bacterium]|nr:protein kinase [Planctomycetota bacterium]